MLQLIRDNAQGMIMWVIIIFVILGLSGFVLSSYSGSAAKNYVIKVNDTEISRNDFQRALSNYQQRLQQSLGENYSRFFNPEMMRESVLEGMIENELITQLTHDAGFRATSSYIFQELARNPAFQDESGQFSRQKYEDVLKQFGYVPEQFERELAMQLTQQQLLEGIRNTAFSLEPDLNRFNALSAQQRDIDLFRINRARLLQTIEVSDEEISQYYETNPTRFMTEEQVQVSYIELDLKTMSKQIQVDDQEIRQFYESNLARYSQDEERSASHILIKVGENMSAEAASKKLNDIKAQLSAGKTFAELAKENSEDPGSASNGGSLGFVRRGMTDKPFEDALYALKVGEISGPVQSQFGVHIIKLNEIRSGKVKPFEEVKDRIRQELQLQKAESRFYNDADKLDKLAYEHQGSLEPAAEALGTSIKSSPFFSRRGGPQIWRNQKVLTTVFSPEILTDGVNSELIELSDDHVLVLRLKELKPAERKPLEQVKAEIRSQIINDKAAEKIKALSDEVYEKLQAGTAPASIAADNKFVELVDYGFVGRDEKHDSEQAKKNPLAADIRKAVFNLARPGEGKPVYHKTVATSGDGIVIILNAVRQGENNPDAATVESMQKQMANINAQIEERSVVRFVRNNSDIDINKEKQDEE